MIFSPKYFNCEKKSKYNKRELYIYNENEYILY